MPKILGVQKSERRSVYYLEKSKETLGGLREILQQLGFHRHETVQLLAPLGDADNNYEVRAYDDSLYVDLFYFFERKGMMVSVFFGTAKAIIVFQSNDDRQESISGIMAAYFTYE